MHPILPMRLSDTIAASGHSTVCSHDRLRALVSCPYGHSEGLRERRGFIPSCLPGAEDAALDFQPATRRLIKGSLYDIHHQQSRRGGSTLDNAIATAPSRRAFPPFRRPATE